MSGRGTHPDYAATDKVRQKFTGYEKDTESELDFAQARYYNSKHGRFTSVDPLMASAQTGSPKTWNRYVYALNNPLRFIDPTGMKSCPPGATCLTDPLTGEESIDIDSEGPPLVVYIFEASIKTIKSAAFTFGENNGLIEDIGDYEHNTAGRFLGHGLTFLQVGVEVSAGGTMIAGGGAEAIATAPLCATGVGCVAPAVGATTAVAGVGIVGHSGVLLNNTVTKLLNQATNPGGSGVSTPTTQGTGRAPNNGTPNSIYEQVDGDGVARSRTYYDENGRSFTRQDYDHSHGGMQPHEHKRQFDAQGHPITKEEVDYLPPGYPN